MWRLLRSLLARLLRSLLAHCCPRRRQHMRLMQEMRVSCQERMQQKQRKALLQQEVLEWFKQIEQELCQCCDGRVDNFERARELVQVKRANVNCTDRKGCTPLFLTAARPLHFRLAQFLLDHGANVDAVNLDGWTPLRCAVHKNNVLMVDLFLQYGANVEPQRWGNFLLVQAIQQHGRSSVGLVELLLQYGASTEQGNNAALHRACQARAVEVVQLLLDHGGVDINATVPLEDDGPSMSPLCRACIHNHVEITQLLVLNGARVIHNGVYPQSPSPLVHAIKDASLELVWFLLENVDRGMLLNNQQDGPHPLTPPLYAAIRRNNLEAVQLLITYGANVINDQPVLWHCVKKATLSKQRLEVTHLLLSSGANVNLADPESGETPLLVAVKKGRLGLVRHFLEAGANVCVRDNGGETPLGVAYRRGHKGFVYLFLRTSPQVWPKLAEVW